MAGTTRVALLRGKLFPRVVSLGGKDIRFSLSD
jgi:predicted DNA-binding transcriptional regulator AlpA